MELILSKDVTEEILESFRRSYRDAYNADDIDQDMIEWCVMLNSIKGVSTEMCCQGHPSKHDPSPESWMMCVATTEGKKKLGELWDFIVDHLEEPRFYSFSSVILVTTYVCREATLIEKLRFDIHHPPCDSLIEQYGARKARIQEVTELTKAWLNI